MKDNKSLVGSTIRSAGSKIIFAVWIDAVNNTQDLEVVHDACEGSDAELVANEFASPIDQTQSERVSGRASPPLYAKLGTR